MGSSGILCDLTDHPLNPAPWTFIAKNEFEDKKLDIPWYLKRIIGKNNTTYTRFPDQRKKVLNSKDMVFPTQLTEQPTYNAFEKDIAIVNFYFEKSSILQYKRSSRLTVVDMISQIGGLLGVAMGISLISVVEIVYWITIRLIRNFESNGMDEK